MNGFVNAGFCKDRLLTEDANKWFYKNKDHGTSTNFLKILNLFILLFSGMMSAAASQGLLYRWDVDNGLNHIDKFLYVSDDYIKVSTIILFCFDFYHHLDFSFRPAASWVWVLLAMVFTTNAIQLRPCSWTTYEATSKYFELEAYSGKCFFKLFKHYLSVLAGEGRQN